MGGVQVDGKRGPSGSSNEALEYPGYAEIQGEIGPSGSLCRIVNLFIFRSVLQMSPVFTAL